jgi:hypothetical protein
MKQDGCLLYRVGEVPGINKSPSHRANAVAMLALCIAVVGSVGGVQTIHDEACDDAKDGSLRIYNYPTKLPLHCVTR